LFVHIYTVYWVCGSAAIYHLSDSLRYTDEERLESWPRLNFTSGGKLWEIAMLVALIGAAHWLYTVKKEREIRKGAGVMSNMKNGFLTCD
jgi:hypothetical protein